MVTLHHHPPVIGCCSSHRIRCAHRWNPPAESFNGLYKTELIHRRGPWKNVDHVEWATLTYVDWFNNRRIHNEIGKIPPAEFEESYYRQTATPELVSSQTTESA